MIVLDTHTWIWWVHGDPRLSKVHAQLIQTNEQQGIGVCTISLWEVAKLVELDRLQLPIDLNEWFSKALAYPGIMLVGITPEIASASTQLPGEFHRDPADQILVATSRLLECPLVSSDRRIRNYSWVNTP